MQTIPISERIIQQINKQVHYRPFSDKAVDSDFYFGVIGLHNICVPQNGIKTKRKRQHFKPNYELKKFVYKHGLGRIFFDILYKNYGIISCEVVYCLSIM